MTEHFDLNQFLENMNFHNYAKILMDEKTNKIKIQTCDYLDDCFLELSGFVYIWIANNPKKIECKNKVLYVGMTMQSPHHRQSTWLSGLNAGYRKRISANNLPIANEKKVGRGRKIGLRLEEELKKGTEINIWVRHSDEKIVFGEKVSIAKTEEDALIAKLQPEWNWEVEANAKDKPQKLSLGIS